MVADEGAVEPAAADPAAVDLELDRPHSARMYDYFLGGTTNFPADREGAGRAMAVFPAALVAARANRQFMHRSVRHLTQLGMRQFLDVGTGIPTSPNLHEIAQETAPESRVVYTDNDPIVLTHAQALLHSRPEGRTAYAQGDAHAPEALLKSPELRDTVDMNEPVALSLIALLHFVPGERTAHDIVEHFKEALPSGSTLSISHIGQEFDPEAISRAIQAYVASGTPTQSRTREEFTRFFDGWELLEPGVTVTHRWRPDAAHDLSRVTDAEAACYAGVARKL